MQQDLILAIDSGTTGTRAIAFDGDQRIVASAYREFPQIFPRSGWVEHDPEEIWNSTVGVMREVVERVDAERMRGVGIANQRETAMLWDRRNGRPIHNAIVWQCRRTTPLCRRLTEEGEAGRIHRSTGLHLDPYFSATKWRWLLDNVPEAGELLEAGRLAAGTVDTWLLWRLSAGEVHATEPSNASRTCLFNIERTEWDEELCELFGVPWQILPEVLPTRGEFGRTSVAETGVDLPVLAMIGDQQSAAFAQGCLRPGTVKNTYGTGLFMLCHTGEEVVLSDRLLSTVAWNCGGHTEYALEGSVFTGGAVVQWLRDGMELIEDAAETGALAESLDGNEGVYFVPALSGLGAPSWDPDARGLIIGLTRATTREHVVRAALEAIAYRTRDVLEAMVQESGWGPEVLRVDGGAIANDFLMQFVSDLLGLPVERPVVAETTALGAAGLAGIEAGMWRDAEQFTAARQVERTFQPVMGEEKREELYVRWRDALERSRRWA